MLGSARVTKHHFQVMSVPLIRHGILSSHSGPTVLITGNLHGDECTGLAVIIRLLQWLPENLQQGQVYLYPSLNPLGLMERTRLYPPSTADLNREFPGVVYGHPEQQYTFGLWSNMTALSPDLLIDLHADSSAAIPYVLVDRVLDKQYHDVEEKCWRLAEATGLFTLGEYPSHQYVKYALDRSLAGCAVNQLHIPALTIEAGPRRLVDPDSVDVAFAATIKILAAMQLVKPPADRSTSVFPKGRWYRKLGPVVRKSGIFIPQAPIGQPLTATTILGQHFDQQGSLLQQLAMPYSGIVVSYTDSSWLNAGQSCATLAALAL